MGERGAGIRERHVWLKNRVRAGTEMGQLGKRKKKKKKKKATGIIDAKRGQKKDRTYPMWLTANCCSIPSALNANGLVIIPPLLIRICKANPFSKNSFAAREQLFISFRSNCRNSNLGSTALPYLSLRYFAAAITAAVGALPVGEEGVLVVIVLAVVVVVVGKEADREEPLISTFALSIASSALSFDRQARKTCAPWDARATVVAYPRPELAPVTMAIFPVRSGMSSVVNLVFLTRVFQNCGLSATFVYGIFSFPL